MSISSLYSSSLVSLLIAGVTIVGFDCASLAHLSYTGRNFGTFSGLEMQTMTITGQTIIGNYGWADGTDADYGDSHKVRIFRFTLENTALITITAQGSTNADTVLGGLFPAFSIYSGLAHTPPNLDHDGSALSLYYLSTLPAPAKEGTFEALDTWQLGNDAGMTLEDLTTFTYQAHAADGTSANYGTAPGVHGDGTLDGTVTGTFLLGPGDYSVFVGGADYAAQNLPNPDANYGVTTTVSAAPVPEPTALSALAIGALCLAARRRRP